MARKLYLAWRFYSGLRYPWRIAWYKAAHEQTL